MANSKAVAVPQSISENPQVLIRYTPENAPLVLAQNTTKMLARIQTVKAIDSPRQLETASAIISEAKLTSDEVEVFIGSLRDGIQNACSRVRELPGYEDFEATLTVRKWSLRTLLNDGIGRLRTMRSRYIADEEEKVRREQLAKQAEQDRINKKAADDAAAAAKKAGASKETVAEIKQAVMETPAPIVTSRALDTATSTVRYQYSPEITNVKIFLQSVLANEDRLKTLGGVKEDMQAAFKDQARTQKEEFGFPGITFKKVPVDVSKRRGT